MPVLRYTSGAISLLSSLLSISLHSSCTYALLVYSLSEGVYSSRVLSFLEPLAPFPKLSFISKKKSCVRSTYYASGCAHYRLLCPQRLERLEVGCHTKVRPECGCHTGLPPKLPDPLHNTIAPPDLQLIHCF